MITGLSELDERLRIESFVQNDGQLTLYAVLVSKDAPCPNCGKRSCERGIFTERLGWLPPNQRKSRRLEEQIRELAFSMSAMQAERVCRHLGIRVSHDTLLRILYQTELAHMDSPFRRNQ